MAKKDVAEGLGWIDKIYKEIGNNDQNQDVKNWLSTGYLPLDYAISGRWAGGGFPTGRIIEIFGGESSGKTMLATKACINTQQKGGLAVFLDYEHAFALSRAVNLGLSTDRDKWIFKQPVSAEKGFGIIEFIANEVRKVDSDKFITVVVDSVASMATEAEIEAGFDEQNMKSRLSLPAVMSSSLKLLHPLVNNTNITLLFLNQTRDNPGVMFGDKKKTPGGNAMKFYASVRIKLSKTGKVKDGDRVVGDYVDATVIKNKVTEPYRECSYLASFKEGINLYASHIEALDALNMLGNTKGYVEFGGKNYRKRELEELVRQEPAEYRRLLDMFSNPIDSTPENNSEIVENIA